ncbi:C40 family peptidase [Paenibacillus donghaensis]|uniref:C40 family peptidase n=1 Tax=Paenibacillus donghaensis TaxID=414771 RepID=UPI0014724260|nr:C40 family peptidase [Paenibacillus donghaensis]
MIGGEGQSFDVQLALDIMSQYMGTPYYFGGRSPKAPGFDCSGILEYAFGQMGIDFSGSAASQYNKTVSISEEDIMPGDFIFFQTYKKGPSHVGMYIGNDLMEREARWSW